MSKPPIPRREGLLDREGWLPEARRIASPNFDQRPEEATIDLLVIHNISLPPGHFDGDAVIRLFTNRLDPGAHPYYASLVGLRVSAHFFIRRDGELIQFVSCDQRAWHAGASTWRGRSRCNDFSIGVELEGSDDHPYSDAQYERLAALSVALRRRYPLKEMVGHADIAPDRKTDPGPAFDWARARNEFNRKCAIAG